MLSFTVCDATGQTWLTAFNDEAQSLLGISANELVSLKEENIHSYERIFDSVMFHQYSMKCRVKQEVYQDESKTRVTCSKIDKIDYVTRSRELIDLISMLA